ncbi:MAG: FtsW/RodA/SpoVE family cell cycle protein [Candidatus Komeilibacteria bacterium]|nr:FtsW/RodA/SpoVE family cell cycle protein [Candidatus Komeilibacteria bacterium]
MWKKLLSFFKYNDWYLIINALLLMIFSLVALYSLQINVAQPNYTFFNRQLIFVLAGLVIFFFSSAVNFKVWSDYYKILFGSSIVLLLIVLVIGVRIRGTSGWLEFLGQTFQPAELVKIVLIIWLAKFFTLKSKHPHLIRDILVSAVFSGILIGLILLQPDFGSAMILAFTWLGMVLLLPIKRRFLIGLLAVILIFGAIFWLFVFQTYQKDRLLTFIHPQSDPLGSGYNVQQAIVAIGSGRLIGRGLGLGSQSQLNFLPEQQTDFIFAVIAEELGLVGAGLVLILFLSLILRVYYNAKETADHFGHYFGLGAVILLLVQIFVNLGMNLGIAPVTGITLPLISYGGSSLFSVLIILGIINSLHIRNRKFLFTSNRTSEPHLDI